MKKSVDRYSFPVSGYNAMKSDAVVVWVLCGPQHVFQGFAWTSPSVPTVVLAFR